MSQNLTTVIGSVVEVFGLVGIAYLYTRRFRFDLTSTIRIGMDFFVPCLVFVSMMDSRIEPQAFGTAAAATLIQIGTGFALGGTILRLIGWRARRELLLPIAFVNSANLPFPLLLANFGNEGLAVGVLCFAVTNLMIFTVGVSVLHGGGRAREALREPALWATLLAVGLRLAHLQPPEMAMRVPRLAGLAAVPLMLVLFGDSLARTRMTAVAPAIVGTLARYASGAIALAITLLVLKPEGILRQVLILYALLPPAVINALLAQRAGRDEGAVASTILFGTLVSVVLLPVLLAFLR